MMANKKPVKKTKVTNSPKKKDELVKKINLEENKKGTRKVNNSNKTAVRIIIIILLLILVILIVKIIGNKEQNLIKIAKEYIISENVKFEKELILYAKDLEKAGYDTKLNKDCQDESKVIITKEDGEKTYEAEIICEKNLKPIIKLKGDKKITITKGDKYTELGATAKFGSKDITKDIVIDDSKLKTDKVGTYKITYSVETNNGKKTSITRTVKVEKKKVDEKPKDNDKKPEVKPEEEKTNITEIKVGDIITISGNGNAESTGEGSKWTKNYDNIQMKVIKINENANYPYALNQYGEGLEYNNSDVTGWFSADSIK